MIHEGLGFYKWLRFHVSANRFSSMTSNIVESINAVTKLFKHCPIDFLFESLRHIVQSWLFKFRATTHGISPNLPHSKKNLLRSNVKKSLKFNVI